MGLFYFLFTIYFIALAFFITKIKFVQNTALGSKIILILFSIKVAAGIFSGLVSHYLFNDISDIHFYTVQSMVEYENLIHNPTLFFTDSLPSEYQNGLGDFFGSSKSFWNDIRNNILVKSMGVFNILSRGNYYINSLFFNFGCFIGHIALYKVFKDIYPNQKWSTTIGCFLLPSTLYFASTISKDLIVFTALSIFCNCLYFGLKNNFSKKRIALLIVSFFTILLIRNFIAAILLPCAIAWYISDTFKMKATKFFAGFILGVFILVLLAQLLPVKYNPLKIIVSKQQAFLSLGIAKSQYQNDTLQVNLKSFASATPSAFRHSFLSPYPTEFDDIYSNAFAAELICFLILFVLSLLFPVKMKTNTFIIYGVILASLIFMFNGYITTNVGSLVRYRSIYLPFLMVPILCGIDWQRILKGKE